MKKRIGLLLITVLALSLAACGSSENKESSGTSKEAAKKEEGETVTVRIANQPGFYPVALAENQGFFEKELEGLNAEVEIIEYTGGGPAITESFTAKEIDFGILGDLPVASAVTNGADLKIISYSSLKEKGDILVAKKDSGIESVKDLKGKKVGVAVGQIAHGELLKLLEEAGLSEEDVEIVNIPYKDAITAMDTGDIDASMNYVEAVVPANEKGAELITISDATGLGFSTIVFAGRTEFTEKYPEITEAILKALDDANAYKQEHKEEAVKSVAQSSGYTTSILEETWKVYDCYVQIGEKELNNMQNVFDFAFAQGLIQKELSVEDVVDTKYLEKAGLQK